MFGVWYKTTWNPRKATSMKRRLAQERRPWFQQKSNQNKYNYTSELRKSFALKSCFDIWFAFYQCWNWSLNSKWIWSNVRKPNQFCFVNWILCTNGFLNHICFHICASWLSKNMHVHAFQSMLSKACKMLFFSICSIMTIWNRYVLRLFLLIYH